MVGGSSSKGQPAKRTFGRTTSNLQSMGSYLHNEATLRALGIVALVQQFVGEQYSEEAIVSKVVKAFSPEPGKRGVTPHAAGINTYGNKVGKNVQDVFLPYMRACLNTLAIEVPCSISNVTDWAPYFKQLEESKQQLIEDKNFNIVLGLIKNKGSNVVSPITITGFDLERNRYLCVNTSGKAYHLSVTEAGFQLHDQDNKRITSYKPEPCYLFSVNAIPREVQEKLGEPVVEMEIIPESPRTRDVETQTEDVSLFLQLEEENVRLKTQLFTLQHESGCNQIKQLGEQRNQLSKAIKRLVEEHQKFSKRDTYSCCCFRKTSLYYGGNEKLDSDEKIVNRIDHIKNTVLDTSRRRPGEEEFDLSNVAEDRALEKLDAVLEKIRGQCLDMERLLTTFSQVIENSQDAADCFEALENAAKEAITKGFVAQQVEDRHLPAPQQGYNEDSGSSSPLDERSNHLLTGNPATEEEERRGLMSGGGSNSYGT